MTDQSEQQGKGQRTEVQASQSADRGYPSWVPRAAISIFAFVFVVGLLGVLLTPTPSDPPVCCQSTASQPNSGLPPTRDQSASQPTKDSPSVWQQVANRWTPQSAGQLGDFVGGVTNPILAFLTLTALIYTINLQRRQLALAAEQLNVMGQELGLAREEAERSREALEASSKELKRSASAQEASMVSQMETANAQTDTARLMRQQVRIQNLVQRYKAAELLSNAALERSRRTLSAGDVQEYQSLQAKANGLLAEIDRVASENP